MKWNIAYLGTYHPAEETLKRLINDGWVRVVVVPESGGFKNDNIISMAEAANIPWTCELAEIEQYEINLVLAANYPKLVPEAMLEKYQCINTHWSGLPRYRGVHPTAWALLNLDYRIGVTVQVMDAEFDTGDVLAQDFMDISPEMTILELHKKLAIVQADLVEHVLKVYLDTGRWEKTKQDESKASYVPKRVPEDGIIDWNWPTERIWNLVRALTPPVYPGAFTYIGRDKIIIPEAMPAASPEYFCTPGQVVRVMKNGGVWVKTRDTCLEVSMIIKGDDRPVSAGQVLKRGDKLGFNPQLEIPRLQAMMDDIYNQLSRLTK